MRRRTLLTLFAAPTLAPLASGCAKTTANDVEVFSWWTGPGESEGLAELIDIFTTKHPDIAFVNAAVAGGSGDKAKTALASRLEASKPPDSFQGHAGQELADYISNGVIEDLSDLFEAENWKGVFHSGLLDNLTQDGRIYAVPVNIHRANLLWSNPAVLSDAGCEAPTSWTELIEQSETFSKAGKTTLSIGPLWTQLHLLETVLLGELGAKTYMDLWTNQETWTQAATIDALDIFTSVLAITDIADAASDWQPQLDKLINGSAAYSVMGDWAFSYLATNKKLTWEKHYHATVTPGSDKIFDYLSDAFTLPIGARHRDNARNWLRVCGSKEGQDAFNTKKGSLPARTDTDHSLYTDYLAWNMREWLSPETTVVGSLAHGAVAPPGWKAEIEAALEVFVSDQDAVKFAESVANSYTTTTP